MILNNLGLKKGVSAPNRHICRRCIEHREEPEPNSNAGSKMRSSRDKEQKQEHINVSKNLLLKSSTTEGVRNYYQKDQTGLTVTLHAILYVMKDIWHIKYPPSSYRYSINGIGVSCTKLFF